MSCRFVSTICGKILIIVFITMGSVVAAGSFEGLFV